MYMYYIQIKFFPSEKGIIKQNAYIFHYIMLAREASLLFSLKCSTCSPVNNLTKVRPLFKLSHGGYDNCPLLIVFSDTYIDQSNREFHLTIFRF